MSPRKLPANEIIFELYNSGHSCGEIAERYSVHVNTVIGLLRYYQVPRRNKKEAAQLRESSGRRNIMGENNPRWKDGSQRRGYRSVKEMKECDQCHATVNLVRHHKDFDHFNDVSDNIQILCASCHNSLHIKAYWNNLKQGKISPSNAPIGWKRKMT